MQRPQHEVLIGFIRKGLIGFIPSVVLTLPISPNSPLPACLLACVLASLLATLLTGWLAD